MAKHDIGFVAPGLDFGVRAIGKLFWWSERVERTSATRRPAAQRQGSAARPTSEREVLDYLASFDVPVIRTETATSAAEAVAAARRIGGPVALKIVSPDIPHKTDVGGVKLNVSGDDAVREAYEQILSAVKQAKPQARIDGVSVAPFRTGGVEILVGVARDPQWGLVMALGLGGVWVEALQDTALRLLPIEEDDAVRALESLRGAKLFKGFRGAPPVDLRRVAQAAVRIGDAALALGPELQALEINPLLASVERVEALDALAVWK
jgi:acyl-CoA synthetase (NDP forming)